jgi:hypothetical protein
MSTPNLTNNRSVRPVGPRAPASESRPNPEAFSRPLARRQSFPWVVPSVSCCWHRAAYVHAGELTLFGDDHDVSPDPV